MNRIEELKKYREKSLDRIDQLGLEKLVFIAKLELNQAKTGFQCARADYYEKEIRIEELVHFCQNGRYPE